MMRVLIVKVSSLGDILHTLPAVTDAVRFNNKLRFDWVVEEAFVEIPSWHPAVDKVIPIALRRWRKNIIHTLRNNEFTDFKKQLQAVHYDLVIDAQGLIKSGLISRLSKGLTVGLSDHAIREPLATLFYNKVFTVPWNQHAVERVRELFSRTFNYSIDNQRCDYGLDPSLLATRSTPSQSNEYKKGKSLIFLHGTTWQTKHWPDYYWRDLAQIAVENGYCVRLPWGSETELIRANSIAKGVGGVEVLAKMSLGEIAGQLLQASGVVALDTGLGHLAAALHVPTVSIYGSTDAKLSGTYGNLQRHLSADFSCSPCLKKKCAYEGSEIKGKTKDGQEIVIQPPCLAKLDPTLVWRELKQLMATVDE